MLQSMMKMYLKWAESHSCLHTQWSNFDDMVYRMDPLKDIPLVIKFVVCSRLLIIDLGKFTSKFCARKASSTTRSRSASHNRRPDICFLSTTMSIFLNALLSSDPSRSISVSFVASTPSSRPMLNHLFLASKRLLYTAAKSLRVRAIGMCIRGIAAAHRSWLASIIIL